MTNLPIILFLFLPLQIAYNTPCAESKALDCNTCTSITRVRRMGSWVPETPFFRSKCRILLHFLKIFPGEAPPQPPPLEGHRRTRLSISFPLEYTFITISANTRLLAYTVLVTLAILSFGILKFCFQEFPRGNFELLGVPPAFHQGFCERALPDSQHNRIKIMRWQAVREVRNLF